MKLRMTPLATMLQIHPQATHVTPQTLPSAMPVAKPRVTPLTTLHVMSRPTVMQTRATAMQTPMPLTLQAMQLAKLHPTPRVTLLVKSTEMQQSLAVIEQATKLGS